MENDFDLVNFNSDIFNDFTRNTHKVQARSSKRKIPVVMISGFLGAGKTTLLNNILRDCPDMKIGAIVNDFGKINIDNRLVSGTFNENQIDLSNGCICCMVGDNGLRGPLDQLANENSKLDAILVEASGVAEPYDLMNVLRYANNNFTFFGGNIYLVDASNFDLAKQQFPTHLKKCFQSSDIILINKTDLVPDEKTAEIRNEIRDLNSRALIIESDSSRIDPRILFENLSPQNKTKQEMIFEVSSKDPKKDNIARHSPHHHDHIHDKFQSITFESGKPLEPQKFVNFLDNLPQNLFRMKGFCYFGMKGYEQKYILQIVGKTIDIKAENWHEGESPKTELVLIGSEMDSSKINEALNQLVDETPEEITPENMMNFERFML